MQHFIVTAIDVHLAVTLIPSVKVKENAANLKFYIIRSIFSKKIISFKWLTSKTTNPAMQNKGDHNERKL